MLFLLLAVSLIGYGMNGWIPIGILLFMILFSWCSAYFAGRKRWACIVSVSFISVLLLGFRFLPLTELPITIPLGYSYYSLQIISYLIDVYKGKYEAEKSLPRYALFVSWLPHLYLGPIESYGTFRDSYRNGLKIRRDAILPSALRVMWGLSKKLLIAARAAVLVSSLTSEGKSGAFALAAMIVYSVELYADFSGGIDIIIGLSELFGIRLSENFIAPYFSESISEFWRKWHVSLGAWLREYIYIPLGGNRKGKARKVLNLVITFFVSGLWHGLEYWLWGLLHGLATAVGDKLKTRSRILNRFLVFLLVSALWSFFIWPDWATAGKMVISVFCKFNYGELFSSLGTLGLTLGDWIVLIISVLSLFVFDRWRQQITQRTEQCSSWKKIAVICSLALIVLIFGLYGLGFNNADFIYSRF